MAKVFLSYSHTDENLRDRLEKHLALKRQGSIEVWHDRRIAPGDSFEQAIDAHLEQADIVLLLISADFLASDYCFAREMQRALERQEAGQVRVIPVILQPCDWHSAPFGHLQALPKGGKAVTTWPNEDEALAEVARSLRALLEQGKAGATASPGAGPAARPQDGARGVAPPVLPRSSNLRVRRQFTELDTERFLKNGFEFIARFFQGSLQELQARHADIESEFARVDAHRFIAEVYRGGKKVAECAITLGGIGGGQITYSTDTSRGANSWNASLDVAHDDQGMFFQPGFISDSDAGPCNAEGAAELLWSLFIARLQR